MKLSRRKALKLLGTGGCALMTGGYVLSLPGRPPADEPGKSHLVTLSFDDGFEKSSIRTAEIYERHNLSACINVVANAHRRGDSLPDEYHAWPVGDFRLWNELKQRGHEIMPHGYKHANLGQMPLEEAKELVEKCIDVFRLELEGFRAEESVFNLPYNSSTPELEEWLFSRFRIIRTHGGLYNPLPHRGMNRLACASFGPGNIDEHLVGSIDEFLEGPPGWFVYNTHGLDDEGWGPLSANVLDELLGRLSDLENVAVLPVIPALES